MWASQWTSPAFLFSKSRRAVCLSPNNSVLKKKLGLYLIHSRLFNLNIVTYSLLDKQMDNWDQTRRLGDLRRNQLKQRIETVWLAWSVTGIVATVLGQITQCTSILFAYPCFKSAIEVFERGRTMTSISIIFGFRLGLLALVDSLNINFLGRFASGTYRERKNFRNTRLMSKENALSVQNVYCMDWH